jgi:pyruvate/2-oxoglutarate dehydrogenase complex dihydrolipoamide dehydrogenase (E3) component
MRERIDALGVTVYEQCGAARFIDPHTIETEHGLRLQAAKFIICTGGMSRRLDIPGFDLTSTHSDAWKSAEVPPSMLVIGSGSTGVQLASMFHAFGTRVQIFERGRRILPSEDEAVAAAVTGALRQSGVEIHEQFGTITSFEKSPAGVRMNFTKGGRSDSVDAALWQSRPWAGRPIRQS